MSERIDETLRRIAAATSKESSPISSNTEPEDRESRFRRSSQEVLGDPNCPHCGGLGYLRLDLPLDHPDFGKVQVCTCRRAKISAQVHRRLFSLSNLDELRHLTFENFQPRGRIGLGKLHADSIEIAFNQSRQFSEKLEGWLFLQGPFGCGKTHLAAAIANFAVDLGVPTLFLTVPDLLDTLRISYSDPEATFEVRFDEIRGSQLLVMDDFGTQNATPWAQEKLFQIVNYRYVNRLPLVVTSNNSLAEIEERIRSRLRDPDLVTLVRISAPDHRNPTDELGQADISMLSNLGHLTFGTFSDRRGEGLSAESLQSLEKALKAAHEFAEEPEGWLALLGVHGSGKTHLAAAIGNYRANLGDPPVFVSAIEFLDHLRATFNPNSNVRYDRRFDEARNARLLILDGLGTQSMTPWAREKIFQLFDYRYNARMPTIITSADALEDLNASEPGLASRMMDRRLCSIFAITAPSYTGGSGMRGGRRQRKR
jgi:DNA replication protein DnaC